MGQQEEKQKKTERVTGLSRRTREEIVKWKQMTVLTGERHQTSLGSLWGKQKVQKLRRYGPDEVTEISDLCCELDLEHNTAMQSFH